MIVEFSKQAAADLRKIAADIRAFGNSIAAAVGLRIRETITLIAQFPQAGMRIADKPGIRVIPLTRYPDKIFYRVLEDRIRILHIRHSSRRPWTKER